MFSSGLNGVVSSIYLLGRMSSPIPLFSIHYPAVLNLAHLFFLAKPIILFSSAYTGYKYIKNCQHAAYTARPGDREEEAGVLNDVFNSVVQPTKILAERTFQPFSGNGHTIGSAVRRSDVKDGDEEVDEFRADDVDEGTNNAQ